MKRIATALVLAAAVGLAGCTTKPIYNVENAPVTVINKKVSADDVRNAIIRAGSSLGWQMRPVKAGQIEGTIALRSHVAVVNIPYSAKSYSIQYKDSTNLNYDGNNIHRNYNGWIQNLDRGIQNQLVLQ